MLVGIIILGFTVIGISIAYAFLFLKYKTLKNKIDTFINESKRPIRKGYIKYTLSISNNVTGSKESFESLVTVKEIDRYTNGESKIEIENIDPGISEERVSKKRIEEYIKGQFISIMKTSDVTWLESEESIKTQRKNKLEHLKEVLT